MKDWVVLAVVDVLGGLAIVVLGPFIGTSRVPAGIFIAVLVAWVVGLMILPVLSYPMARRVVQVSVTVIATLLIVAMIVSGGLRAPVDY